MSIKHTPKKILFAMNLSLQQITLSHRTFGKLQFLLEMLLNRQINTKLELPTNKLNTTHLPEPM